MHWLLLATLALAALFGLVLAPAIALQAALRAWFRGAERVPLDEVWAERFEAELAQPSAPVH